MTRDQIILNILQEGVIFKSVQYQVVGCSNSQVQKKSFVFAKKVSICNGLVEKYIPGIEELQRSKGVAKRVKYAGLLFTGCRYMVKLPEDFRVEKEGRKYESRGSSGETFDFTDGCGIISLGLVRKMMEKNKVLQNDWKDQIPTVWQIRYYGPTDSGPYLCKGINVCILLSLLSRNRLESRLNYCFIFMVFLLLVTVVFSIFSVICLVIKICSLGK